MRIGVPEKMEESIVEYKAGNFCHNSIDEIGVNVDFLIEALQRFKKSDIRFCVTGKMSPILLRVGSNLHSEYNYKSVIMPIQIKKNI